MWLATASSSVVDVATSRAARRGSGMISTTRTSSDAAIDAVTDDYCSRRGQQSNGCQARWSTATKIKSNGAHFPASARATSAAALKVGGYNDELGRLVCLAGSETHSCESPAAFPPQQTMLAPFDATAMLRLLRNRTISFIGDSLSVQLFQQLACLLRNEIDFRATEAAGTVPFWRCPPGKYETCRNKFQRVLLRGGAALQSQWIATHARSSHKDLFARWYASGAPHTSSEKTSGLLDADVLLFQHGAWLHEDQHYPLTRGCYGRTRSMTAGRPAKLSLPHRPKLAWIGLAWACFGAVPKPAETAYVPPGQRLGRSCLAHIGASGSACSRRPRQAATSATPRHRATRRCCGSSTLPDTSTQSTANTRLRRCLRGAACRCAT